MAAEEHFRNVATLTLEKEKLLKKSLDLRKSNLEGRDTSEAMKSVQGIQARIDELIAREKEAIHEHYQSKMSKSKLSGMLE